MRIKTLLFVLAFTLMNVFAGAQQVFTENFNYTLGQTLTSNNWTQVVAGTAITVTNPGLTYSGYVLSNIGNAATLNSTGQAVYRDGLNNVSSGSLYSSFMINISAAQPTGDYFFSILPQGSTSINTSFARVFARSASSGYYQLGIAKLADAPVYGNDSFAIGTTIMVVTKYVFVPGSNNDSCVVWGFKSGVPATEPTISSAIANGSAFPDAPALGRFVLRQGTGSNSPALVIDGIRSGVNWADLNASTTNLPPFVSSPVFTPTTPYNATLTWTNPTTYDGSTMTTLVFVKAASAITQGTPNLSPNNYAANSNFASTISAYQNDANALCVFKDTTNSVAISGLTQGTNYYALIYIVRNTDSAYSIAATTNGATPSSAPGAITAMTFTATGANTATINWTKPAGYSNTSNSIAIFVKPVSAITAGTPNANPQFITGNSNFTGNGTRYQNDSFAHCVYKGDTNFVMITGLTGATTYYVMGYAINDPDSNYSVPATASGITNIPTPSAVGGLNFTAAGSTNAVISWNRSANYSDALFTTLVFVKQNAPITTGTPNAGPGKYISNTIFMSGTPYQNDAIAYCVYKGDTNSVQISGLTAGTNYSVLVYVVRDADSLYSAAANAAGATAAAPPTDVTGITFIALSSVRAQISWTLPGGFNPINSSLLVFVKQGSAINKGTPTHAVNYYTANTTFGNGTAYQNDASAYCVLRSGGAGVPTNVTVNNLNSSAPYYVLIYVVRRADSTYSNPGATGSGTTQPPSDVTGLSFSGTGVSNATISWTRPANYSNASYTTLVFVKQGIAVSPGTPTRATGYYSANSSFAGTGSVQYQNDGSAWCVYKGDTDFVNISALNNVAPYYVLVYIVRDADSVYSSPGATTSGSALSTPPPAPVDVSNVTFTGLSSTSAHISWTKPSGYVNGPYTTLVFVKQVVAISAGIPTKPVTYYIANSSFGLGNGYQNDAAARCVYKGDTDFVNITNINNSAPYYVLIYVVREVDSTYSPNGATGTGSALPSPPPPPTITSANVLGVTTSAVKVRWIKPSGYDDATMTTLVFVKQGLPITAGTPTRTVTYYTANAVSPFGTTYQNDAAARCAYKGDTDFVYLTNLSNAFPYQVLIYVITDADSSYSTNGATASGRALTNPPAPPADVSGVTFTGLTTTAARITWTKPTGYNNALWTTMVFVKQASAVNAGTPSNSVSANNANAFLGLGSAYQNDASAWCVFKGDTNFVNIGNITNGSPYYVLIYVVTDFDSIYSANGATGIGNALPTPPPPPYYLISQVNSINQITGVPDSVNARAGLRGIVYGFNLRPPGVEFLLRDVTGGITVSSASSNFGYTVTEGDSIEVQGTISTARGLLQISALDTLKLLGSGKQIKTPVLISKPDESSENDLVRVNIVKFITAPSGGIWPSNSSINCIRIGSTDTITIRIPASSPLAGLAIPSNSAFSIIGMGSQISTSITAPYSFNGYNIIPRSTSDIIPVDVYSKFNLVSPANNSSITAQTNLATLNTFTWNTCNLNIGFDSIKYTFQLDTITGNFSSPRLSSLTAVSGTNASFTISNAVFANLIGVKFVPFAGKWRVIASANLVSPVVQNSDSIFNITVTVGIFSGINEQSVTPQISVYPNPGNGIIHIISDQNILSVVVFDMTGRVIKSEEPSGLKHLIDGSNWEKGIYFIKVNTSNGQLVKRILIQ